MRLARVMKKKKRPLIIGEVLYDKFAGSEEKYLGGAPFNVAWALRGFGYDPLFVSRIGKDAEGDGILLAMEGWGMDTRGIQIDTKRSTGVVEVIKEGEENRYNILEDMAYDHIEAGEVLDIVKGEDIGLIYHGSLLSRGEKSWRTLLEVKEESKLGVFVDLNLRKPYYEDVVLDRVLSGARWLKLNVEELKELLKVCGEVLEYGIGMEDNFLTKIKEGIIKLESRYKGLSVVGVTLGGRGAVLSNREIIGHRAPHKVSVADTVGAGDGFSSMMLMCLMEGIPCSLMLDMAVEFSSNVCGIKGATINEERFYKDFALKRGMKMWGDENVGG